MASRKLSTKTHTARVVEWVNGMNWLRRGSAYDDRPGFDKAASWRLWLNGTLRAERTEAVFGRGDGHEAFTWQV